MISASSSSLHSLRPIVFRALSAAPPPPPSPPPLPLPLDEVLVWYDSVVDCPETLAV